MARDNRFNQQTGQRLPEDNFPMPYNSDNAEAGIDYTSDGRVKISFTIDRDAVASVIERWTWNSAKITIIAGDRDIVVDFPAISEEVAKR